MIDLLQVAARKPSFMIAFVGALIAAIGAYFYGRYHEQCKRIEHNVSFYFLDRKNNVKGPKNILALMDYSPDTQIWNESQQKWMKISELPNYVELKDMHIDKMLSGILWIGVVEVIVGLFIWPLCF